MQSNHSPLVSVVLPTCNRAQYLPQAIGSVLSQTLTDWECIIVDDASSDGTAEVVQTFVERDSRIHSLRHNTNQGPAIARNTGIEHARGTYIAFQDDDDLSHPERLQRQVEDLQKRLGNAFSRTMGVRFCTDAPYQWGWWQPAGKIKGILASLMAPRALLQQVSFRHFFRTIEDHDLYLRLQEYCCLPRQSASKGSALSVQIPQVLYAYRHAGQANRASEYPFFATYACLAEISALCRRNGLPDFLDGVHSIDEAVGKIPCQCFQYLYLDRRLEKNLTGVILENLVSGSSASAAQQNAIWMQQIRKKVEPYLFTQRTFRSYVTYCKVIKNKLCRAIILNQFDVYQSVLRFVLQRLGFLPLLLVAPRVMLGCICWRRWAFIPSCLRGLVGKMP